MTLFKTLIKDHDTQRDLLERLMQTRGDSEERETLFKKARLELVSHAAADERALYVPMMEIDETQEQARHSVAEHNQIDELIEKLEGIDFDAAEWLTTAEKLQKAVTHHLDEEEETVFQMADKVIEDHRQAELARLYREEMDDAR